MGFRNCNSAVVLNKGFPVLTVPIWIHCVYSMLVIDIYLLCVLV